MWHGDGPRLWMGIFTKSRMMLGRLKNERNHKGGPGNTHLCLHILKNFQNKEKKMLQKHRKVETLRKILSQVDGVRVKLTNIPKI